MKKPGSIRIQVLILMLALVTALLFPGRLYAEPENVPEPAEEQTAGDDIGAVEVPEADEAEEIPETETEEEVEELTDNEEQAQAEEASEDILEDDGEEQLTPVYRLYNPKTGEHLFTDSLNEVNVLYQKHGWNWEGIGWYAPESGRAVYRLYDPESGQHLYTASPKEKKALVNGYGWTVDNSGKPVFYSGGSCSVYRLYQKSSGAHHLTLSGNEYDTLAGYGWTQEGTSLHAASPGRIPGKNARVSGKVTASAVNGQNGTFKVTGSGITSEVGVKGAQFAVWRDADQSDIKWYRGSGSGSTFSAAADVANHRLHFGTYTVHLYLTLGNGVCKRCAAGTVTISPDNYISVTPYGSDGTKKAVTVMNADIGQDGVTDVKVAVWSADMGQDDLVWYSAKSANGKTFQTVIDSERHNRPGKYHVHVYGTAGGKYVCLRRLTTTLKRAELRLTTQLDYLDATASTNQLTALRGAKLTAAQRDKVNRAILKIRAKRANVGFVVMNLQSGKTLAYNAGFGTFGASTIKGPYVTAVCRANPAAWKASSNLMIPAITVSNNQAYAALRHRYGGAAMKSLFALSRLSYKNPNQHYPNSNARELTKLWCGTYSYLKQDQPMAETLRGVFTKTGHSPINRCISETTYSKPGWMESGVRRQYHDAGIVMSSGGPYVIAVITTLDGNDHATIDQLVHALHEAQSTM